MLNRLELECILWKVLVLLQVVSSVAEHARVLAKPASLQDWF